MFTSLLWNLTGKFLILSVTVYVLLSCIAAYFFNQGLTEALDEQLEEIARSMMPLVEYKENKLDLKETVTPLKMALLYSSPTISLFDIHKEFITSTGAGQFKTLMPNGGEISFGKANMRALSRPVKMEGQDVGYIQIQLATTQRDRALLEFLQALCATAPLLLVALAGAGYLFARRAITPIENTFALLRRFMSDAGHELKTPIAVIHATCDNLSADLTNNKHALERVEVISRSADRMQRLVSDLLLLTKSERATLTLKMIPLRFDMLLREVLGEFGDLCEDKGITLDAKTIVAAKVNGDKDALHRMLANLLENASNYTNAPGTITVSLMLGGGGLILKVSDTGIGIPPEALPKIFDRFYRVDESRSRAKGGSGLGLSIVKAIAESHHGNVTVASEVGKGTTFTVALPVVGQTSIFGRRADIAD